MIVSTIRKQAQLHSDLKIAKDVAIMYLNDGVRVLATMYDTACRRATATITAAASVWVDLPANTMRIVECKVDGLDYDFYEASLGQIRFEGSVTNAALTVLTTHPDVATDTDESTIHALYHGPLALYVAARERQRLFADEENDAQRLMSEFYTQAMQANARLCEVKGTRKILRSAVLR